MKAIPFIDFESFSMRIALGKNVFRITLSWNPIGQFWAISLFDNNDIPLVESFKLSNGYPVFDNYSSDGMPEGMFVVADLINTRQPLKYDSFMKNESSLLYLEPGEI